MHISVGILAAVLGTSCLVAAAPTEPSASDFLLELNDKATTQLESTESRFSTRSSRKKCTIANAAVRRDW
jgi:tyrosinase